MPSTIEKKNIGANICYTVANINGIAYIGMSSVLELLKHENLIVGAATILSGLAADIEKKFNDIVAKGATT